MECATLPELTTTGSPSGLSKVTPSVEEAVISAIRSASANITLTVESDEALQYANAVLLLTTALKHCRQCNAEYSAVKRDRPRPGDAVEYIGNVCEGKYKGKHGIVVSEQMMMEDTEAPYTVILDKEEDGQQVSIPCFPQDLKII